MHRTTGSYYKHSIAAENSTARDSSYIKEGFILRIRFVETGLGDLKKSGKWTYGEGKGNCSKN